MAREGSSVLYGQPLEGLVVVKITRAKQKQAKELMDRICDNTNLIARASKDSNENVAKKRPGKSNRNHNIKTNR
jgi:hypothetical protein